MRERKTRRAGRFDVPAGAVYALAAAMALICFTVLAVVIAGPGGEDEVSEPPAIRTPHLYIEDVFFSEEDVDDTTLKMTIYITNDGTQDASEVSVDIWPVAKETNIATEKQNRPVGDIPQNCTREGAVTIHLTPSVLHSVEVRVMESGMLILKGRALVTPSGKGGSEYQNVEVKGSRTDSDYDGMPDEWERYYGLDPSDRTDAQDDNDGDGIPNVDEYRRNEAPASPQKEGSGTFGPLEGLFGGSDTDDDRSAPVFLGAGLLLLLVIGAIAILIFSAARSSSKNRLTPEGGQRAVTEKNIEHQVAESHRDVGYSVQGGTPSSGREGTEYNSGGSCGREE